MRNITKKELEIDNELNDKADNLQNKYNQITEYNLDNVNNEIDELEEKGSKLEEALNYFKELWQKFIEFLQDKFFSTNKYDDVINDLYDEEILDEDDLKFIENRKNNDKSDDFER